MLVFVFFFFKQKTAYELRISDWSSDVCSSDLRRALDHVHHQDVALAAHGHVLEEAGLVQRADRLPDVGLVDAVAALDRQVGEHGARADALQAVDADVADGEAAVGSDSRRERVRGGLGRRDAERGLRIDCFLCPGGGGRDGRGEGKDKQAAGGGTRHQIGSRWESWPRRWAVGAGLDSYRTKLFRMSL